MGVVGVDGLVDIPVKMSTAKCVPAGKIQHDGPLLTGSSLEQNSAKIINENIQIKTKGRKKQSAKGRRSPAQVLLDC